VQISQKILRYLLRVDGIEPSIYQVKSLDALPLGHTRIPKSAREQAPAAACFSISNKPEETYFAN
jgi:hypothetical protein